MHVRAGVPRLDDQQVVVADLRRELLEPRNDARVLDVVRRSASRPRAYCTREQGDEHDADRRADRAREQQPAAHAGQRRAGDEQQRPGQDDRQEPPRHPEVLRDDPDLVEEEQRERRQRDDERRVAPEQPARDRAYPISAAMSAGHRHVETRERPERVRVVVGQLARRAGAARTRRSPGRRRPPPAPAAPASTTRCEMAGRSPRRDQDQRSGRSPRASPAYCHAGRCERKTSGSSMYCAHRTAGTRRQRRSRRERRPERPAHALARRRIRARAPRPGDDRDDRVEPQEQQQPRAARPPPARRTDRRRRAPARWRAAPRRAAPASRCRRSDSARTRPG